MAAVLAIAMVFTTTFGALGSACAYAAEDPDQISEELLQAEDAIEESDVISEEGTEDTVDQSPAEETLTPDEEEATETELTEIGENEPSDTQEPSEEKPVITKKGPVYDKLPGEDHYAWHYYYKGKALTGTGWLKRNGIRKYYLREGRLMTGLFQAKIPVKLSSGKTEWQSHYFYFSKGSIKKGTVPKMLTGYRQVTVSGKTKAYYFKKGRSSQYYGATFKGPVKSDGKLLFYNNDKNGLKTGWVAYDNKAYYFYKGNEKAGCKTGYPAKYYTLYDKKYNTIKLNGSGYIGGKRGKALAYGIKVLDRKGWSLKNAYTYSYKLKYANRPYRPDTVAEGAIYGFTKGNGNCFVMNCCFHVMADLLGCSTRQLKASVGPTRHPHSWLEIYQDGKWWVYDANFRNETGRNGFKIYYGKSGTWKYNPNKKYLPKY